MRQPGAVKHRAGTHCGNRGADLVAVADVHALPAGEPEKVRSRLGARPGDEVGGAGEVLQKVAAGESAGAGHENHGMGHRLWLTENAEEVRERSESGENE